jgi:large subunit ribosomal protein L19
MKKQLEKLESKYVKKERPEFCIGDTVDVHFRIKEENKMRIQVFSGIVIARKGSGVRETFMVRRISYGEGVERVFPLHSPVIESLKVISKGIIKRSKLYYLRDRVGKKARVKRRQTI